jgi:hypothetical protein
VEIELDDGSAWRLGADSQGAIADYTRLATGQRVTLLSLDHGVAYFTGESPSPDSLILAVAGAQVTVTRGTRLRLEVHDQISQISVLEGTVRFSSPAAELDIHEGQSTRVEAANPARFFLDREIAALELDRWSEERDKALETSTSAAHTAQRYGLVDLDAAGEWTQTDEFGPVWKPKTAQGWVPFQQGRWRWYDGAGYTWVSDDPWGWLPYHYGRWLRKEDVGWVWAPGKSSIFKPGEVYWLRSNRLAGWGPLAPGEQWMPGDTQPAQYLNANTVFAAYTPEALTIDPAGFTARPKDPLAVAAFAAALPSPAFLASKLDAMRPLVGGRGRVAPAVEGATIETAANQPIVIIPPQQPPVVVVQDPPPPPPDPTITPYPVPVPVPILVVDPRGNPDYRTRPRVPVAQTTTGQKPAAQSQGGQPAPGASSGSTPPASIPPAASPPATAKPVGRPVIVPFPEPQKEPPKRDKPPSLPPRKPAADPPAAAPPASTPTPAQTPVPASRKPVERKEAAAPAQQFVPFAPASRKLRSSAEAEHVNRVVQDLASANFAKAVSDLDGWTRAYRDSEWHADRLHYYMLAFDGTNQPARVLDAGAQLIARGMPFRDGMQVVSVLYLTSMNFQRLPGPTREQAMVAKAAATDLLAVLPESFKPANRPSGTSEEDWSSARGSLEALARQTLTAAEHNRK